MNFHIFTQKYNTTDWLQFLNELFQANQQKITASFSLKPTPIAITEGERVSFDKVSRLGAFATPDGFELGLYEVTLNNTQVERNRITINKLVRKYMLTEAKQGVLVVFVYPEKSKETAWRFSFISQYTQIDFEANTETKQRTALNRYTYLFGKQGNYRTAIERFTKLAKSGKGMADFFEAFAVEPLSREFYNKVFAWYETALKDTTFNDQDDKQKAVHLIKIITRLVFIWFLKEKKLVAESLFEASFLKQTLSDLAPEGNSFYSAVLENLFFDVLNKPIPQRFKSFETLQEAYIQDLPALTAELNKTPFVNGGLFDSHEAEITTPQHLPRKLKIPNRLFFNDKETGLIDLLKAYQFTAEESTPLEQEVALDPELLGKIFENLLASVDEHTGQMARKATGSFYTPREIVDYMVEESLVAYLKPCLQNVEEAQIRQLLDYQTEHNPFDKKETKNIIKALDTLKILDPACGSGAFPMGILHKILVILKHIDADNTLWLESLISSFPAPMRQDMRKKYEGENLDYLRKLGIILKTIYGVDIQPVAVQIAKLRCFLSLIIDQNTNQNPAQNYGVKPLPNLEFKFIAADSLVGMPDYFQNGDINNLLELQESFAKQTEAYFSTNSEEKQHLKQAIQDTMHELVQLYVKYTAKFDVQIKKEKENPKKVKQLQERRQDLMQSIEHLQSFEHIFKEKTVSFYETRFFFPDVQKEGGFNIILGNPPYVSLQKMRDTQLLKKAQYKTFENTGDLYSLFYEKGYDLLAPDGLLCFITSNKWINANYGKSTRKFIAENTNPLALIDFGKVKIFETATVFTNILLFQKAENRQGMQACTVQGEKLPENLPAYFAKHRFVLGKLDENIWKVNNSTSLNINETIETKGTRLSEWTDIKFYRGITTGFNDAFHIPEETKDALIAQDANNAEIIKPLLRGKDIKRWKYNYEKNHIIFTRQGIDISKYPEIEKYLRKEYYEDLVPKKKPDDKRGRKQGTYKWYEIQDNTAYYTEFSQPKIVWIEISDKANYAYDERGMYLANSAYFMVGKSLKYLLAVLNSSVADYYFFQITAKIAGGRKRYTKQYVEQVPVPIVGEEAEKPFEKIVDYILFLKEYPENQEARIALLHFEGVLNAMVYELYFAEQVRKANREILAHIGELPCLLPNDSPETKMHMVLETYAKTYHKDHPIRNSVFFMSVIPEVAEIINTLKQEKTQPETELIEENEN